ncbi:MULTISPECIES: YARHG domain-containing protein [Clostridia]|uniref:YARHG domain-containing protein n=1 Tax=Clostridia TaxID=186801 RepID=UPI000E54951E|nr:MULTISPECIES: YARHG domain-containing protein [Clostridia]RHV71707.1 YARHG domain-containing protein [Roseburia sp. OM02-15]
MKFCIYCGHEISENAKFCTICGKEQIQNKQLKNRTVWTDDQDDTDEYMRETKKGKKFKTAIVVLVIAFAAGIIWKAGIFQQNNNDNSVATIKNSQEEVSADSENKETKTKTDVSTQDTDTTLQNKQQNVPQDNVTQGDQNEVISTDEYILPTDTQYISESDLWGLTQEEVALARNEVYARHGYVFQNQDYQNYFSAKSWYQPDAAYQPTDDTLSKIEKANVDLIVKYEVSKGWRKS